MKNYSFNCSFFIGIYPSEEMWVQYRAQQTWMETMEILSCSYIKITLFALPVQSKKRINQYSLVLIQLQELLEDGIVGDTLRSSIPDLCKVYTAFSLQKGTHMAMVEGGESRVFLFLHQLPLKVKYTSISFYLTHSQGNMNSCLFQGHQYLIRISAWHTDFTFPTNDSYTPPHIHFFNIFAIIKTYNLRMKQQCL